MEEYTSIDIILAQKRQTAEYKENIYEVRKKIRVYRRNLCTHWQGAEMTEINRRIDKIERKLNRVLQALDEVERLYCKAMEAVEKGEVLT